ncbi:MAG: transglycosylase SLT domain-containing protein [Methylotenera sp.]|nr:transglycosylase SLT domain-containing protein [Oligoflexia bacterium]
MKYLFRVTSMALAISIGFLGLSAQSSYWTGLQGDPSNDFSFHVAHARVSDAYTLMSEKQISKVLADQLQPMAPSQVKALSRHLTHLCQKHHFDPAFILSLIQVESGFRTHIVSPAGAVGLMQLMPATAQHVAKLHGIKYWGVKSLQDPFINLTLGVTYLSDLKEKYRGQSPYVHIAAYNVGPARMDELIARKSFKPTTTKKYYEDILKGVSEWRYYGMDQSWATRG